MKMKDLAVGDRVKLKNWVHYGATTIYNSGDTGTVLQKIKVADYSFHTPTGEPMLMCKNVLLKMDKSVPPFPDEIELWVGNIELLNSGT